MYTALHTVSMVNKLVEQYAKFLDEDDVMTLFEKLEKVVGNLQDAAKECNITRKTVYNWKTLTHEMKLGTKEKILEQSFEKLRLETMEFLARKMTEVVSELLFNFLLTVYKKAFSCKDSELSEVVKKFEEVKQQFAGILYNKFENEIADLSENLAEYVNSKNNNWKPAPFYLYNTQSVSDIVKEIVYSITFPEYSETPQEMAIRLHIPTEIVTQATKILPLSKAVAEPKLYDFSGTNNFFSLAPQQQSFGQFAHVQQVPNVQQRVNYQTSGATWVTRVRLTAPESAQSYIGQIQRGVEGTTRIPTDTSLSKENKPKALVLNAYTK